MELTSGEHTVAVEYIADLDFDVKPKEPGNAAALSLITVPTSAEIQLKSITETITIDSKEWARLSIELDYKINLKKREKNVLIHYRVNFQNNNNEPVYFRILLDDKELP